MASKREGLMDAGKAALEVSSVTGTTKPVGLTVHRMRTRPIEVDSLPAIVLYLGEERTDRDASLKTDRKLRFFADIRVEVPEGVDPDTALDPLLVWAVKALLVDYTLGGLAMDLAELGTTWEIEERTSEVAAATIEFELTYQTATINPESAG